MLELERIYKRYNKNILSNFSYSFLKGKIYGIIGKSGCGKSTLLSIIGGLDKHYKGNIFYEGNNIKNDIDYTLKNVSYIYQTNQLFENLSGYENIFFINKILDLKIDDFKVKALSSRFKVLDSLNKKVKDLSGGEKQRIGIVRGLYKNSPIILLDEPTSALDKHSQDILLDYLNTIKKEKIIIIVTHNMDLLKQVDEVINLDEKCSKEVIISKIAKRKTKPLKYQHFIKNSNSIFKSKRIFDYLITSLLTLGLIGFFLSNIITYFVDNISKQSFELFNSENYETVIQEANNEIYDFKNELKDIDDCIIYEGLDPLVKENIKNNNPLLYVLFNYHLINDVSFIFDNYLVDSNDFILSIPYDVYKDNYINGNNKLLFTSFNKSFQVNIDRVLISEDDSYCIYYNNPSYLKGLFEFTNEEYKTNTYIFSYSNIEKIYYYLLENDKYINYQFVLQDGYIQVLSSSNTRLSYSNIIKLQKDKVLLSDNIHTYIDFETGFIFLIEEDGLSQLIIDESLENNTIAISKKYLEYITNDHSLFIFDKEYQIVNITNESHYPLIYMNIETFNNLNENIYYQALIIDRKNDYIDGLIYNDDLFEVSTIEVFNHINNFINLFSYIILGLALISSLTLFSLNFKYKEKEVIALIKLGIRKNMVSLTLLFDPIKNYIYSFLTSIFTSIIIKFFILFYYQESFGYTMDLTFDYLYGLKVFLIPFTLFFILLSLKITIFYKKISV